MNLPPSIRGDRNVLERHLQRRALRACESISLEQSLQIYRIALTNQVISPQGKVVILRARDIINESTWKKFLSSIRSESRAILLHTDGLERIELYQDWLLHDYTDRYRWITTESQRLWLEQVVTIVVVRHTMKQNYHRYLIGDQQAFAEPGIFAALDRIYWKHDQYSAIASCVKNMIKEPECRQQLIEEFYMTQVAHLQKLPPLAWELLPPLPGELPLPYLLLANE